VVVGDVMTQACDAGMDARMIIWKCGLSSMFFQALGSWPRMVHRDKEKDSF